MTREQAKSELMQIYMSLSEEKKQALDVLMAQADGEYISIKYIHSVLHNHMFDNAHRPTIYAELKRISKELDGLTVAIPSAEPKTGHWIDGGEYICFGGRQKAPCICSVCRKSALNEPWYYCPNCGAKMVEPQERGE